MSQAALPPAVKSLNYLNNIMAKIEAHQANAAEALMLNEQGYIAECTADNVFIIKRGTLFTPPVSAGSLRGITRGAVLDIAIELGIPVVETELTRYDVFVADECFLTGTAAELVPVVNVDSRPVGDGKPGQVTARLLDGFRRLTSTTGTPIFEQEAAPVAPGLPAPEMGSGGRNLRRGAGRDGFLALLTQFLRCPVRTSSSATFARRRRPRSS